MKEAELRKHLVCSACGKPVGHVGVPLFSVVKVERHGILLDQVKRQDGLTAMLGGNARLAQVMGADAEMTQLMDSVEATLCEACAMEIPAMALLEVARPKEVTTKGDGE